jgi:ankyrin repeat protein
MSRHQNHQRSVGEATPLHEAARAGDVPIIKELIASVRAHFPSGTGNASVSLLHFMLSVRSDRCSRQGSNVNAPDNHKRTPLHLAAFAGHEAAVRLFFVPLGSHLRVATVRNPN